MKGRFHPLLSLGLFLAWLALNNTLDPGQVLLALVLALALPPLLGALWPGEPAPARMSVALRLLAVVLWDIVVANVQVARLVLGPESALRPAFITVPLDLRSSRAIALLAGIITMTPGTVSAEVAPDRQSLLVHALDVDDEAELVRGIKARYEAPLAQIFPEDSP